MRPPQTEPIGLELARTARLDSRAFDEALGAAGGSLPMWLVLLTLKAGHHGTQRSLAAADGIEWSPVSCSAPCSGRPSPTM
ncbi:MAG: hypothetical protein ACRDKW_04780 [Actinomycetota bacterium]